MFLKNVKAKLINSGSITTRLTLFYSITTFVLITVIAFFIYGTMVHILHKANYRFLTNEVGILTKLLKKNSFNWSVLEQKVIDVPYTETGSDYHYYIRIMNEKNQLIIETPNMGKIFRATHFFNNKKSLLEKESDWWDAADGRNYLLIQAPITREGVKEAWRIQIALDISYQQAMISKYYSVIFVCLILGTVFAIFLGYFLTRRGMRSLFELTETTKKITAASLNQQIDPESWPKELKNLAMAFNQMLKRIETSVSRLTQFSADLAHELRTPVNNIMGETEILLSHKGSIDEYQQVLGSNLEELHRISQIIDNLLFLARMDNLQLDISKEFLNVADEVQLICEYYQPMAEEKNIKITWKGNAEIRANSIMFRRMINNLLSNALQYTPENGAIHFDIHEVEKNVHILIKDNGTGINSEHLPHIFNRFYRADAARSKHSGGTGLGLAIVKSIVELHQGSIAVTSQIEIGTQFYIIMPK